jgi:restriction endonuclease S subunit
MASKNIQKFLKYIFSGYSFRNKVEHDPNGDLDVIQMKDLEMNYTRIGTGLIKIDSSTISPKYLLEKGDVLLVAKGGNNFAILFDLDLPKAIASSAFFVLRPNPKLINPGYLAWYINQKPVQQYFIDNRVGTYMPNINKNTILGIEIKVPEKITQERIVEMDALQKREYLLSNELLLKRKQLISYLLFSTILE